jgi:hypothetical protein
MKIKRHKISFNVFKYDRKDKIHFVLNVLIGIAIALFFHYSEKKEYGGGILDAYFDTLVSVESTILQKAKDGSSFLKLFLNPDAVEELSKENFAFVEIDRLLLEEWDGLTQPLIPRDRLADLIGQIAEKNLNW